MPNNIAVSSICYAALVLPDIVPSDVISVIILTGIQTCLLNNMFSAFCESSDNLIRLYI